jgi:hypothetical protein
VIKGEQVSDVCSRHYVDYIKAQTCRPQGRRRSTTIGP